jgi:hypothetical protein
LSPSQDEDTRCQTPLRHEPFDPCHLVGGEPGDVHRDQVRLLEVQHDLLREARPLSFEPVRRERAHRVVGTAGLVEPVGPAAGRGPYEADAQLDLDEDGRLGLVAAEPSGGRVHAERTDP